MTNPVYLLLDLETSGLNPNTDSILEVGAILLTRDLTEISRKNMVVKYRGCPRDSDPFVTAMHEENGLWAEAALSDSKIAEVDKSFYGWLDEHAASGLQLAGYSIHFDRSFLDIDMPLLVSKLSHKQRDISSLARELRDVGYILVPSGSPMPHRSMPDCERELEEWKYLRMVIAPPATMGCVELSALLENQS